MHEKERNHRLCKGELTDLENLNRDEIIQLLRLNLL